MTEQDNNQATLPASARHPGIFIIAGFLSGIFIWLIDTAIDVFILEPEEKFLESLLFADGTELWMRTLVVLVLTLTGYFASRSIRNSHELNNLLSKHQHELEELVQDRNWALEKKTAELEKLATIDPLTHIYNRRKFTEVATDEFIRFQRYRHSFCIYMLDIDNFKAINDTHGHEAGDHVISTVATMLGEQTRTSDYFGRWGGEEFIILTPESNHQGQSVLAEKLLAILRNHSFNDIGKVTASIGISEVRPEDTGIDDVIRRADKALYEAKNAGKNCFQVMD